MRTLAWARSHAADLVDGLLFACLAGSAEYEVWVAPLFDDGIPGPRLANGLLVLGMCLPLLWRRRRPVVAFSVMFAAGLVLSVVGRGLSDQPPTQTWLVALIGFYSVAAHAAPRRAAMAGVLVGAVVVAGDVVDLLSGGAAFDEVVPGWFLLAAAWGLGYALRGRQQQATTLADRADRLEREREAQARAAVAAERARMARELHDVVAHSLSVMVVQAQAAERVLDGEQASAREALAAIDSTGRQALVEMRRLVGILRDDRELALAPQPGLGQLDALLEHVRDAGLPVALTVEGDPRPLAPGVDLSAYRIVQEALTNALKHAGPARAWVAVRYRAADVELEVTDDGRGPVDRDDGGHGLVGMRERVALYGGALDSGARNGHGFRVRARLPL
jgi:signal transduction histidine kinase